MTKTEIEYLEGVINDLVVKLNQGEYTLNVIKGMKSHSELFLFNFYSTK